jgi:hypothetical protein
LYVNLKSGSEIFFGVFWKKLRSYGLEALGGVQKVGEREAYIVENATDTKTERVLFRLADGTAAPRDYP